MTGQWGKKTGGKLTLEYINKRAKRYAKKGWGKPKWMLFAEYLINKGFQCNLYEARKTNSKYITISKNNKQFKVRFSDHKPIKRRELAGDCDFFVGMTHTGTRTTRDAYDAVIEYFNK